MPRYTLTLLDTSGIQHYLFSTNNLRQNAGASYLADCATRKWVQSFLPEPHNVTDLDDMKNPFNGRMIEKDGLQAEVLYAGGGNTAILFQDIRAAQKFARQLTSKILMDAPGLTLSLVHHEFDWANEPLGGESGIVARAFETLAKVKQHRTVSHPILGLGVTSRCVFTDQPAVDYDKDNRPVSAETWAKVANEYGNNPSLDYAYSRLVNTFFKKHSDYRPARDFDDLGRTSGESSYVAIVHADGNGMGNRIAALRERFPDPHQNREYIATIRAFSNSIRQAAYIALRATVDRVAESVEKMEVEKDGKTSIAYKIAGQVELAKPRNFHIWERRDANYYLLPIRPLVFGGDDVTFVCDGRLGLSLAAFYVQEFSRQILSDGLPAYCRAGVAIVHSHYPFAPAYNLAERLCESAKKSINQWKAQSGADGFSAIDWHYAVGGLVLGLSAVRQREYTSLEGTGNKKRTGDLLMRPLLLDSLPGEWRTWTTFQNLVQDFLDGEDWRDRRNKVKALREALRNGPKATQQFLSIYRLGQLPSISGQFTMSSEGWQSERCGYFDAIEAMDTFIDLTKAQAGAREEDQ